MLSSKSESTPLLIAFSLALALEAMAVGLIAVVLVQVSNWSPLVVGLAAGGAFVVASVLLAGIYAIMVLSAAASEEEDRDFGSTEYSRWMR